MAEAPLAARIRPRPEVLHRILDGEAVLLRADRGLYYGLDAVGARIWDLLVRGESLEAVLAVLVAEYEVCEATARADLIALVGELEEQGLVEVVGETPAPEDA